MVSCFFAEELNWITYDWTKNYGNGDKIEKFNPVTVVMESYVQDSNEKHEVKK